MHIWLIDHEKACFVSEHACQSFLKNSPLYSHQARKFILSYYLGKPPEQIEFICNSYGKPFLKENFNQKLFFNVSHSNNLSILAISKSIKIGIDIEDDSVGHYDYFFQDVFSHNEEIFIRRDPRKHFFSLWTAKEAYCKSVGLGLNARMNKISFIYEDDNSNPYFLSNGVFFERVNNKYIYLFHPKGTNNIHGAVTIGRKINQICIFEYTNKNHTYVLS